MPKLLHKRIKVPSILKIGEGELQQTGDYFDQYGIQTIACFFSAGIEDLAGDPFYKSLAKKEIKVIHKETIEETHIETIVRTALNIPGKVQALAGIGGGKALDYSKYAAHVLNIPFISIPTSLSNDGFCSPTSSLLVNNKKASLTATIPFGVIIDLDIVRSAPASLVYSGIGDLISKITAGYDWYEAAGKKQADFHDFAYLISQNTVREILYHQNLNIRETAFLYNLANSLLMNGLSMEIAGSSRPASGSEHLICHAYDQIAKKPSLHGLQVGLGTYLCSYLQDNQHLQVKNFLLNTGFVSYLAEHPLNKSNFKEAIRKAPDMKEDFYTILSDKENIDRAIAFIEQDQVFKKVLKDH
jgi:glycerol-1-phosphate dehydrogenase [NAD(P)+]